MNNKGVHYRKDAGKAAMRRDVRAVPVDAFSKQDSERSDADRQRLPDCFRQHLERLPLAHVLMDTSARILDWTPAAERVFGFTQDEAIGRSCLELLVPPQLHRGLRKL